MDYLIDVWVLDVSVVLLSMHGQKARGFHQKKIVNVICVPKMNEGLTGLELNEGGVINYIIFGWTMPLIFFFQSFTNSSC